MSRVAVVGARRNRQGTGEYVASAFARAGCAVRAVVGTAPASVDRARRALRERHGLECKGYLTLPELLDDCPVDIVAICTPPETHRRLLETALDAGCHVFCEKPLWWAPELLTDAVAIRAVREQTEQLIERGIRHGRYLDVNTQWPFTLPAFRELHRHVYSDERPPKSFAMWLSPISRGPAMAVDSGSHLLSMLYALAGPGTIGGIEAAFEDDEEMGPESRLTLRFAYTHARGKSDVRFDLRRCPEVPRPAGYSMDGFSVERHVERPGYVISFQYGDKRVNVGDPLVRSVEHFVSAAQSGESIDRVRLLDGMTQLMELVRAATHGSQYEQGHHSRG